MTRSLQRGTTLVELIMTIVIISLAIAGVVGAFALISGRSANVLNETRAVELAQLYMDEIFSRKYDEATPQGGVPKHSGACIILSEEGSDRANYDDVDDYDNLSENPASPLGSLAGYNGFNVSVSVACAGAEVGLASADAKRITVTVTPPGAQSLVFTVYRANF